MSGTSFDIPDNYTEVLSPPDGTCLLYSITLGLLARYWNINLDNPQEYLELKNTWISLFEEKDKKGNLREDAIKEIPKILKEHDGSIDFNDMKKNHAALQVLIEINFRGKLSRYMKENAKALAENKALQELYSPLSISIEWIEKKADEIYLPNKFGEEIHVFALSELLKTPIAIHRHSSVDQILMPKKKITIGGQYSEQAAVLHLLFKPGHFDFYLDANHIPNYVQLVAKDSKKENKLSILDSLSKLLAKHSSFREWLANETNQLNYSILDYRIILHRLQKILYLLQNDGKFTKALEEQLKIKDDSIILIIEESLESVRKDKHKGVNFYEEDIKRIFFEEKQKANFSKNSPEDQKKEEADFEEHLKSLEKRMIDYCSTFVKGNSDQIKNIIFFLEKKLSDILKKLSPIDSLKKDNLESKEEFDEKLLKNTRAKYQGAEFERHLLLNANVVNSGTSRFVVLDVLCTLLWKYRAKIKTIFTSQSRTQKANARVKFRGSLVRNLKGYPKNGVAPTLNKYDCDAFIEVTEAWWIAFRGFATDITKIDEKTGKSKITRRKLREYESAEAIKLTDEFSHEWPEEKKKRYGEYKQQLRELALIQIEIRKEISKTSELKDYAKDKEGSIDFGFYLRPISSVEKTYQEGNPYTRKMIEDRGYPEYAESLKEQPIEEFEPVNGVYKRPILATVFQPDEKEYKGITLPEYQVVIGKHNWYIENKDLFKWRMAMRGIEGMKGAFSRRKLSIYQDDALSDVSIQRKYLILTEAKEKEYPLQVIAETTFLLSPPQGHITSQALSQAIQETNQELSKKRKRSSNQEQTQPEVYGGSLSSRLPTSSSGINS